MNDKKIMFIVAFVSILCAIWALFVPSYGMSIALVINSLLSVYLAFKLEKKD